MFRQRSCGILLHPTSLPGAGGIGTFNSDARCFVDLLSGLGCSLWQVLPLTPPAYGNSPYSSLSAFAGNPLLIDLDQLVEEGDLDGKLNLTVVDSGSVDFTRLHEDKIALLRLAARRFLEGEVSWRKEQFWHFCDTTPWLHDYALFMALKHHYKGSCWQRWPAAAQLKSGSYERLSVEYGPEIGVQKYIQWQFYRQWDALRSYANQKGVRIIGDIPIFVAYDSADVWCNPSMFLLDGKGRPTEVAGVPPDYFSVNGQLWGNPLYNWDVVERDGYRWWVERIRHSLRLFDGIRIDHFRGFEAAWQVPATHRTARHGRWVKGPGSRLFDALKAELGELPIMAEDLGVITPEVGALRDHYSFPGMNILQFAFDSGPDNPYLPHNHSRHSVVYTGTHDNNTTQGWIEGLASTQKESVCSYAGCHEDELLEGVVRLAMMSVADTAILPFQDLLRLGTEARMNLPGIAAGNWRWRFQQDMLEGVDLKGFYQTVHRYGRVGSGSR